MTTYTLSNHTLRVLQQLPFDSEPLDLPENFYIPAGYSIQFEAIRNVSEMSNTYSPYLETGARILTDLYPWDLGFIHRALNRLSSSLVELYPSSLTPDNAKTIAQVTNNSVSYLKKRNINLLVALNDVTFTNHDVTLVLPPNRFESFDKTLTQAGWNRA